MDDQVEYKQYVYDFNQFKDDTVDEADVKANPEKYLEYVTTKVPESAPTTETIEDRVQTLEQRQDDADQALQDLICTVMGE